MKTYLEDGIPTVDPDEVNRQLGKAMIIDVRRPEEFIGELGHISGSRLLTLGPELEHFLAKEERNTPMIFVCKSGGRSAHATLLSQEMGFTQTVNMKGGMLLWNHLKLATER